MDSHFASLAEEAVARHIPKPADPPPPRWVSVKKAAHFTDLSEKTIRTHIASGDIIAVFAGRVLRVDLNSVDAWLRPVNGGRS